MFDPREKIALFIDGANLYATSKALGFDIDYRKPSHHFQQARLCAARLLLHGPRRGSGIFLHPPADRLAGLQWLHGRDQAGQGIHRLHRPPQDQGQYGHRADASTRSNWSPSIDHYVIFSGDGDFRTLVEALQRRGRKVSVVSTMTRQPPMIADDLRRQADNFIDLDLVAGRDRPRPVGAPGAPPGGACLGGRGLLRPQPAREDRTEPDCDCALCPRLHFFRDEWRGRRAALAQCAGADMAAAEGADAVRLLVVGLAPGLRGANRTGRPFTGDYAGDLLYRTLTDFGMARGTYAADPGDGLELVALPITNAVRCVPPQNKPTAGRDRRMPAVPGGDDRRLPASARRSWHSGRSPTSRRCRRWAGALLPSPSPTAPGRCRRACGFFRAITARATTPIRAS